MNNKLNIAAWCLYDWACASFPIIVTTFIFSTYFISHIAVNSVIGTSQWANATAIAGIFIAVSSPLFGAIADYSGYHKRWLLFFTSLSVICCALLWFAYPNLSSLQFTLIIFILGTISTEIAYVFYNAFLPHLVKNDYIGRVSGWGWGSGYLGGIVSLTVVFLVFVKSAPTWLNTANFEQIRICGPFAALWFAVFSIPLFLFVPESTAPQKKILPAIRLGYHEFITTLRSLPQQKNILLYLIAHMVYTDGLNTLFAFGGIYAAGTFHFAFAELLIFAISMNFFAGLGAIGLAWVDDWIGSKPTILISLASAIVLGIPLVLSTNKFWFWGFALLFGLFVGPTQAASRSLMARITNPEKSTEMFGLYALSGKITAFIGPWILGMVTLHFQSQRAGIATILLFFLVGGVLLMFVRGSEESGNKIES